ncbi:MAG: S26 family signal peptidase [Thermoplasmata archaeon]|nr:MAG: S26 family signal peptidase [Thermoplasmata archaeon]
MVEKKIEDSEEEAQKPEEELSDDIEKEKDLDELSEDDIGDEEDLDDEDIGEGEEAEEDFEKEEDEKEDEEEEKPLRSAAIDIAKDVVIAFIIVIIIIGSIYLYTGNWPPVVVVESDSMQHSDDESFLGVIDTGDLVLVKSIEDENDVISYMKGKRIGHETYGEYGDVLIYRKNGWKDITPVIHRTLIWLDYNETYNSFDFPELKNHEPGEEGEWYIVGGENRWYNLQRETLVLRDIGYDHIDVSIDLDRIYDNYAKPDVQPHSGFITLGDHNGANYDQNMLNDGHGKVVEPIIPEWIVGKARGELPWFGLIKLYFQDETITERAPENSWTLLWITLILIFAVPISIDIILIIIEKRREMRGEEEEKIEEEPEEEKLEEEEEIEEDIGEEEEAEEKVEPKEEIKEEEEKPPPPDDWEEELPPPDDWEEELPPPED